MARMTAPKKPKPVLVNKFYGVNESVGETEIKLGEAVYQRNFRITKNFKPQKREGYSLIDTVSSTTKAWYGRIGGTNQLIYNNGNDLISLNDTGFWSDSNPWDDADAWIDGTTVVGTLAGPITDMAFMDGKLYILANGFYEYDGSAVSLVVGYIPTVEIGGEYDGTGATNFEEINLYSTKVIVNRIGDGATTQIDLLFDVTAVDSILIDGSPATYTFTPPRTINITSGTPADNAETVITCDLGSGLPGLISENTRMIVFGPNDAQLFLWGRDNNTVRQSGLGNPTYFPVSAFSEVGTDETPITDMKPIFDRLIGFKEDQAKYTYAQLNPLYDANVGLNKYTYEYFDLNDKFGSLSTAEIINSTPLTLDGGAIYQWDYQSVVNNVDPDNISDRIRLSLEEIDLSTAVTFNHKRLKEYWFNVDGIVYIYNYGTDAFYMYDNIDASWFLEVEGTVYFGGSDGVYAFTGAKNDNGTAINATLELAFTAYDLEEWVKSVFYEYLTIASASRTSCTLTYATDEDNETETDNFVVKNVLFDYGDIDYGEWSYATNRNPQSQTLQTKIKKFRYIKHIFKNNDGNETLTVLSWKIDVTPVKEAR